MSFRSPYCRSAFPRRTSAALLRSLRVSERLVYGRGALGLRGVGLERVFAFHLDYAASTLPRRSSPSGDWLPVLGRCRRGSIRRTERDPSSRDHHDRAGPRRVPVDIHRAPPRRCEIMRRSSSRATSSIVIRLPLPVGHSTFKSSP